MSAATINLSAVIDTMGGTQNAPVKFTAQAMRGGQPAIRVAAAVATLPKQLVAYWNGTAWTPSAPALTDIAIDCYWRVELAKVDGSARIVQSVQLPTGHGGTVNYGDLAPVDPSTLVPTPSVLQTWLTGVDGKIAAQAVSDAATYVAVQPTAPDPTKITAWVDKTTTPPTVKGWNGTAWVAIGGGGGGTVADATTSAKGIVQLGGDLGGTAAAPTVPGLAAKAPLASPAFTGTPTVPTATTGTSTTQAASTAFVATALAALINGAPGALDQLNELAAALGNDANFASTITNALALKAPLASPAFTGSPTSAGAFSLMGGLRLVSRVVTASGTITLTDIGIISTATTAITLTLTASSNAFVVVKNQGTQPLTVAAPTTGTAPLIDAAASVTVAVGDQVVLLGTSFSVGSWIVIATGAVSTAQAAAIGTKLDALAAPVTLTASGTMTAGTWNLLDATSGVLTATLPTPTKIGQRLIAERQDAGTNLISFAGTVRGVTTGLPTFPGVGVRGESIDFEAESFTSWRIISSHKPKALLDQQFAPAPTIGADGNYHSIGA